MKKEMVSEWTRQQLCAALFSLMKKKPLDKICVREICEACDIPRSTFYYHFTDIYDLTSWALSNRLLECLESNGNGDCLLWGQGLLVLFQRCRKHKSVCRCAVNSSHLWQMADSYCNRCMDGIMTGLRKLPAAQDADESFLRFLGLFYGHAVLATVVSWFRSDMEQPEEELVASIDFIVKDSIIGALEKAKGRSVSRIALDTNPTPPRRAQA